MLYFLYGPDGYRKHKRLNEIVVLRRDKYPQLILKKFDLETDDLMSLLDFVGSQSLFETGKRMAIVSGFSSSLDNKMLAGIFSKSTSDSLIFIISEDWKEIPKYIKEALGEIEFKKEIFNNLIGEDLADFIKKESESLDIKIDLSSIKFLARSFNGDIWGIINEIKRLSLLKEPITLELLKSFGRYATEFDIFDFARRISSGTLSERLLYWEAALLKKIDLFLVFGYLGKFASGSMVEKLARADIKIKSGILLPEQALLEVIL